MDRATRDGDDLAARPPSRGQTGGVDRSRTSRCPHSAELRRQEHPDLAHRTCASAARRGRRGSERQIARSRDDLFNRRTAERIRGGALSSILLRGGRLIDPASGLDGQYDVLVRNGSLAAVEPAGARINFGEATVFDAKGCWV